jgi:hypothetical protein
MNMKKILVLTISLVPFVLLGCAPTSQTQRSFTPPSNWPTINKTETEFRRYLDENADNLNPIEGIWTMNESGTWRNVYSGMTGSIPSKNAYRLAIVKDTTTTSYDFIAVVLESQYPHWMPGNEVGGGSNLQNSF